MSLSGEDSWSFNHLKLGVEGKQKDEIIIALTSKWKG
jgi:hypothetical protein